MIMSLGSLHTICLKARRETMGMFCIAFPSIAGMPCLSAHSPVLLRRWVHIVLPSVSEVVHNTNSGDSDEDDGRIIQSLPVYRGSEREPNEHQSWHGLLSILRASAHQLKHQMYTRKHTATESTTLPLDEALSASGEKIVQHDT